MVKPAHPGLPVTKATVKRYHRLRHLVEAPEGDQAHRAATAPVRVRAVLRGLAGTSGWRAVSPHRVRTSRRTVRESGRNRDPCGFVFAPAADGRTDFSGADGRARAYAAKV